MDISLDTLAEKVCNCLLHHSVTIPVRLTLVLTDTAAFEPNRFRLHHPLSPCTRTSRVYGIHLPSSSALRLGAKWGYSNRNHLHNAGDNEFHLQLVLRPPESTP